jgi:hypothetical protein
LLNQKKSFGQSDLLSVDVHIRGLLNKTGSRCGSLMREESLPMVIYPDHMQQILQLIKRITTKKPPELMSGGCSNKIY